METWMIVSSMVIGLLVFLIITVNRFSMKELEVDREIKLATIAMKSAAVAALKEKVELRLSSEDLKYIFGKKE